MLQCADRSTDPCARRLRRSLAAAAILTFAAAQAASGQLQVTTQHNDVARTGQNTKEKKLTLANVNTATFGLIWSQPVDGQVYAQPLYMQGLAINGAVHNVVFVATQHDSVYAFDADITSGANAQPLWHTSFLKADGSVTTLSSGDVNSDDINPEIGITGTPVIDPAAGVLYVIVKTKETVSGNTTFHERLHALSIATGQDMPGSPVEITASVPGTGDAAVNGVLTFDPLRHQARPGLLLLNGVVYIGFGSHGDNIPYHGWVIAYNAATLRQVGVWVTTPNGKTDPSGYPLGAGGIWMSGNGLAADASGNIYFQTGNGTFDVDPTLGGGIDFGDSVIKLSTAGGGLSYGDSFTPYNEYNLDDTDYDLGSGGVLLLPDSAGSSAHRHLLVGAGKQGRVYVVDRDNMGKFNSSGASVDNCLQDLDVIAGAWSSPAYWNGNIYYASGGDVLKQFTIGGGVMGSAPSSQAAEVFGYPGATPSVSSNGTANGIVWVIEYGGDGGAVVHAYNAADVSSELYNSNMSPGRDVAGPAVKFAVPTIVNGKVYVGTVNALSVYGLGQWAADPVITPGSGSYTGPVTVSVSDGTPGAIIRYTTDGTVPATTSHRYVTPFTVSEATSVKARAFVSGVHPSGTANSLILIGAGPGTGDGLYGTYFSDTDLTTPEFSRIDPTVNFNWNGTSPGPGVGAYNWSARWTGRIQGQVTGDYTLYTYSDDGVRVWFDGSEIINDWTNHPPTWDSATVHMSAGGHYSLKIEYFQGGGGSLMQLYWSDQVQSQAIVPQSQLYSGQVGPPVITPPGGTFDPTVLVSITEATPGAAVYYTLDGTPPTTGSTLYTEPFALGMSAPMNAKAFLGGQSSTTTYARFLLNKHKPVYQVNCGGNAASPFIADSYFSGGGAYNPGGAVDTSSVTDPAPQAVYASERFGQFTYVFPNLTPGASYTVRLHFAEIYWSSAGQRSFNVAINGSQVLSQFDVFAAAGGSWKAVCKEFAATADAGGSITIAYTYGSGTPDVNAKASGIEIIPR